MTNPNDDVEKAAKEYSVEAVNNFTIYIFTDGYSKGYISGQDFATKQCEKEIETLKKENLELRTEVREAIDQFRKQAK